MAFPPRGMRTEAEEIGERRSRFPKEIQKGLMRELGGLSQSIEIGWHPACPGTHGRAGGGGLCKDGDGVRNKNACHTRAT